MLHSHHPARDLEAEPSCVVHDALADQTDCLRLFARTLRLVAQNHQSRRALCGLADAPDASVALLEEILPSDGLNFHPRECLCQRFRLLNQRTRRHLLWRCVADPRCKPHTFHRNVCRPQPRLLIHLRPILSHKGGLDVPLFRLIVWRCGFRVEERERLCNSTRDWPHELVLFERCNDLDISLTACFFLDQRCDGVCRNRAVVSGHVVRKNCQHQLRCLASVLSGKECGSRSSCVPWLGSLEHCVQDGLIHAGSMLGESSLDMRLLADEDNNIR
mmetsp:Transcript_27826/g.56359  ORF Transcript_27826/g.56359 Transcript_27826/m.56359 type:complete len:274 (+) Transcript_27826:694-1515(+)